ncbi:hypothetical protein [Streptosporangium sp. CA-115845]|uniref:hypothetical protein n=1 Tax=Streptosporangium sp. CA-115845 TaxID=3240071 RepID=UPI003D8BEE2A
MFLRCPRAPRFSCVLAEVRGIHTRSGSVLLLRSRRHLFGWRRGEPIAVSFTVPRCGGSSHLDAHRVITDPAGDSAADRPGVLTGAHLRCAAVSRECGCRFLIRRGRVMFTVLAHSRTQHSRQVEHRVNRSPRYQ